MSPVAAEASVSSALELTRRSALTTLPLKLCSPHCDLLGLAVNWLGELTWLN